MVDSKDGDFRTIRIGGTLSTLSTLPTLLTLPTLSTLPTLLCPVC
jgi:hypothetical protein